MATARRAQALSRVDGLGLSVGALDMLFCALGAIMLIFAMQERVVIEQAQDPASKSKVAALTQSNKTLEAAAANRSTQWAGVQALPAVGGSAVFVLDLSGSLANEAQRRAQRHLVTQYVLQNDVRDFAVVYFANSTQTLVRFGQRTPADWESDLGTTVFNQYQADVRRSIADRAKKLRAKGIPEAEVARMETSGLLEKLSWFDIISRHSISSVGTSNTRIDDGLKAAIDAAPAAPSKPHLVLISDGQMGTPASDANQRYFTTPEKLEPVFQSRTGISLVDPSSSGFANGITSMERFVGPTGNHTLINGYGILGESPPLPENPQEPTAETDYSLQGTTQ
jgi:hypothetical protein